MGNKLSQFWRRRPSKWIKYCKMEGDTKSNNKIKKMVYSMGPHTLSISPKMFADNRSRLIAALKDKVKPGSVIVLEGGKEKFRYNTDADDLPFRQESYFFWAFGVQEGDCYGAIDISSGKSVLFPPLLHPDYAIWLGRINPESWFKEKYEVDEVHFNDKNAVTNVLKKLNAKELILLRAENTDSNNVLEPANFEGIDQFAVDTKILYPIIAELRVFKTDSELEVMRYAAKVASDAHKAMMKAIKPNMYEYQLESVFRHSCYFNGACRHLAYTCIAASGCNGAILHYGHASSPNDKKILDGDMCIFDMGPEYHCYASDVTTSFPCNGKFSPKQKIIYNVVLNANREVFKAAKPGVRWTDMHKLAERVMLTELKAAGLLTGSVDDMMLAGMGGIFMPHGLGHFLGLDVHDVGGYLGDATPRASQLGLKSLRTTRTLKERMVLTIEPGCYFIDTLLDSALKNPEQKKFIDVEKLKDYRGFGGVRIEDDVVIWEKGNELLNDVPRTVSEIEKFMAS